jgi:hypothetical protein
MNFSPSCKYKIIKRNIRNEGFYIYSRVKIKWKDKKYSKFVKQFSIQFCSALLKKIISSSKNPVIYFRFV